MKKRIAVILFTLSVIIIGCKDKIELPSVTTGEAQVMNDTKIVACEGSVTADGGDMVFERGVCYLKGEGEPTISNKYKTAGSGRGTFIAQLGALDLGSYSYRAYASNEAGTAYGDVKTFEISDLPYVTTGGYTLDANAMSATCNGTVTNDGGGKLIETGICYIQSSSATPTTANSHISTPDASKTISVTLTGLQYNTTYRYRAYATNGRGTAYGEVKSITVPAMLPTVVTGSATVNGNNAVCTGTVSNSGITSLTKTGICIINGYNTPTVTNNDYNLSTTNASTNISVTASNLSLGTTYSYCAYATNSKGTSYGTTKTFTTASGSPTVTTLNYKVGYASSYHLYGLVTSHGVGEITQKGICYIVGTGTPTINDNKKIDYGNNDSIDIFIYPENISSGNTYRFRAFATNSSGLTGYGSIKTLKLGSTTGTFGSTSLSGSFPTGEYYSSGWVINSEYFSGYYNWYPKIFLSMTGLSTGTISGSITSATWSYSYISCNYSSTSNSLKPGAIWWYDENYNRWYAKSYTITVTQIDTAAKRASLSLNAVMFKESEAYNSTTGEVNVDNATTQTLSLTITDAELIRQNYKKSASSINKEVVIWERSMKREAEQGIKKRQMR
ncbi:MAG: hypothetical protein K6D59_08860 [Bacteroidales bacterium]|nr:hypothetical protein [Bacteroidales bacterium]